MGNENQHRTAADGKFFQAMMEDAAALCDRRNAPVFTHFLTEEEQGIAVAVMKAARAQFLLYGGCEDAERRMLGIFPPYEEPDTALFPMDSVTAEYRASERLEHRAVLGTLMAQGIERNCIGDILIENGRCVFFCRNTVTRALIDSIDKMGGTGVRLRRGHEQPLPAAHSFRDITDTVASARLDCLVAALAGTGRGQAEQMITAGEVMLNSVPCKKVSQTVRGGDKLTVRGKGKFIIDDISEVTRKGRLILSARKYS